MRTSSRGYLESVEFARKNMAKKAAFGFNTGLDLVRNAGREEAGAITKRIFGKRLLGGEYTISAKRARELADLGGWKTRIGGQAGNMANDAAAIGVRCYVHSASKSEKIMRLFRDGAMVARKGRFVPAGKAGDSSVPPIHFVLEFPGDRIILSHDECAFSMKEDGEFYAAIKPLAKKIGCFAVGGFHLLQGRDVEGKVAGIAGRVLGLKGENPEMKIHLEWGDFQNVKAMEATLGLFAPVCDSVGFNEKELERVSAYLRLRGGKYGRAQKMLEIVQEVVVHTSEYSFALSEKNQKGKLENSLLFASLASAYKAVNGRAGNFAELEKMARNARPRTEGIREMKKFERIGFACNAAFAPSVACKPKITVGLGDCFAMAFALTH
ncbi:MAG: hypothetical protein NT157_04245 [Candidatus Micrarchaeota archaeon]|nr:hypothetical protein [Candidatus Micrarchaeota archaeon]